MSAVQRLVMRTFTSFFCVSVATGAFAAVQHPMDPLEDTEILGAAFILLGAGAAQPGTIFQSIDLREPSKDAVLAFQPGNPISRAATVYFRQDKKSYKTVVNLDNDTFTPLVMIPKSDGQLGLTITEVSDFGFAFSNPAFLGALAARGITTPAQLANVLVTPLTPGSFGLPEESRRIDGEFTGGFAPFKIRWMYREARRAYSSDSSPAGGEWGLAAVRERAGHR